MWLAVCGGEINMKKVTFAQAINEALKEEMRRDSAVIFMGEDIGLYHQGHGPCGVSTGMLDEFGENRVIETPIAESVIMGAGVGMSMFGLRPVVEFMHSEFMCDAFEHIVYGATKSSVTTGAEPHPVVIRAPFGGTDQGVVWQNENNEGWFNNAPGLKIVIPSTPYDAKGLLKTAIRDDYPVIFLEHSGLYKTVGEIPEEEYFVPIGRAIVRRQGSDITVLTYGNMALEALKAAEEAKKKGISLEVVDLRTVAPLDKELIISSVKKTGRVIIFHEARKTGGLGGEIAAMIAENAFPFLKAPVIRVAGPDVPSNFPINYLKLMDGVEKILGR